MKYTILLALAAVASCDKPIYGKAPAYPVASYGKAYAPVPYAGSYSSPAPAYSPAPSYPRPSYGKSAYKADDYNDHPQYNYAYDVKDDYTGNDYRHVEYRDGYDTKGEYKTLLPDGRYQTVTYTADENGFNAYVNYEGEARYPDTYGSGGYGGHKPAASPYAPAYKPAPAPYRAPAAPAPAYYSKPAAAVGVSYNNPEPAYEPAPSAYRPSYVAAPSYSAPVYAPAPVYSSAPVYSPAPRYGYSRPAY